MKRGEKYPVKGNAHEPKGAKAKVEYFLKEMGVDMNYGQFDKFINRLDEITAHRGPEAGQKLIKEKFGAKAAHASDMISAFNESGLGLKIGLADRRGTHGDSLVEPTADEVRRAQIADAWLSDKESRGQLASDIDPAYLENEHMQGDVARAWVQHERAQENEEIDKYEPEHYEVEAHAG